MGFFLVNLLWVVFSIIGALPIWFSSKHLSLMAAIFESVSAVTTTGSTVFVGLDQAPPGLLLWRSMLQWFGGIGIAALGLFIMPFLRVGGLAFFRMESSDTNEKPLAKLASFMRAFVLVYLAITVLCGSIYRFFGMSDFDAVNHAMTTVATGGFSTHDTSFAYFRSDALLWAATFFMTVCSLPFSIIITVLVRRRTDVLFDPQIRFFLGYFCLLSLSLASYHWAWSHVAFSESLAHSFFTLASILSTTGFASQDYTRWGSFAVTLALFATFIGGCSGSTAGGMKAYRFLIILNTFRPTFIRLIYPNSINNVRYGRFPVDSEMLNAVFMFFATYMLLWAGGSLLMSALGYDILTSISSVITALSNVGPGVGPVVGPTGNFASLSEPALLLLSVLMIMGRLEILTVLVVMTPAFWRR